MTEQNARPPAEDSVPLPPKGLAALRDVARQEQGELPFAVVMGEVYTDVPQDLYIPPEALEVFLQAFEGPLDLLLYLIKKQNLDILDINVFEIARQYAAYVDLMMDLQLELAAEYLVMAAMLAEIKSRMLLPRREDDEEEDGDPRAELIRRLQEYEQFREAAERLDAFPRQEREFFVSPGEHVAAGGQQHPPVSWMEVLLAMKHVSQREAMFEQHHVTREALSTRDRMNYLLDLLTTRDVVALTDLYRPEEGRPGVVVSFLAMMELTKENQVEVLQNELFGPVHMRAKVHE